MIKALALHIRHTKGTVFGSNKRVLTALVALSVACLTVSCATPAPRGESADISVSDVQAGGVEKGLPVRWGGTIAKIHNKDELTVLEIVSRPLLRTGRPRHNDVTHGRFMAEISGFLDPEIVAPGRDISVIGTIVRVDDGLVGEAEYRYPVMSVFDYRFWKKQSEIDPASIDPNYYFSRRYWRDWPHRRHPITGHLLY